MLDARLAEIDVDGFVVFEDLLHSRAQEHVRQRLPGGQPIRNLPPIDRYLS